MAITITKDGYGQVEPNHLSAPRNGQVYAQLPVDASFEIVEQGMFLNYDLGAGKAGAPVAGQEPLLVFSEEKLYDANKQSHKDFALLASESADGKIYPRFFKTVVGDIYTTNSVKTGVSYTVGDTLQAGADGFLAKATGTAENPLEGMVWKVVKETTMPDAQPAVKLQRIQ